MVEIVAQVQPEKALREHHVSDGLVKVAPKLELLEVSGPNHVVYGLMQVRTTIIAAFIRRLGAVVSEVNFSCSRMERRVKTLASTYRQPRQPGQHTNGVHNLSCTRERSQTPPAKLVREAGICVHGAEKGL